MIGLRSVDLGEKQLIREKSIRAYTMTDIDRIGGVPVAVTPKLTFAPRFTV